MWKQDIKIVPFLLSPSTQNYLLDKFYNLENRVVLGYNNAVSLQLEVNFEYRTIKSPGYYRN